MVLEKIRNLVHRRAELAQLNRRKLYKHSRISAAYIYLAFLLNSFVRSGYVSLGSVVVAIVLTVAAAATGFAVARFPKKTLTIYGALTAGLFVYAILEALRIGDMRIAQAKPWGIIIVIACLSVGHLLDKFRHRHETEPSRRGPVSLALN